MQKLGQQFTQSFSGSYPSITLRRITLAKGLMMGAAIAYAVEQKPWWHVPVAFVVPTPYIGYHAYRNREQLQATGSSQVREWLKELE
jgi:hypothetical protein